MRLTISRTLKEAWKNATRNGWLTVATLSVMVMALFVIAVLLFSFLSLKRDLRSAQDKLSVSVYFKTETTEKTIQDAKDYFQKNSDVREVEYVSREKALEDFKKENADNQEVMQSLEEIGDNPLWASLIIRAYDAEKYESIASYAESSPYREEISRVNYGRIKEAINRLSGVIRVIERIGVALGIIFSIIAILNVFNTIRVTIYAHKKEIEVMRLVGASNSYIRLPFIFEGLIYGLSSALISMLLLFLSVYFLVPFLSKNVQTESLNSFFWQNALLIFGIQIGIAVILGIFSSLIAMRRYLKI